MPDDIKEKLHHVSQGFSLEYSLGTSLEEILSSEQTLIKNLTKGFSMKYSLAIVSNIKKAIIECTQDTSDRNFQQVGFMMAMMAPAAIFTLSGDINIEFDEIDDVLSHPALAGAMMNFNDLFEAMMGTSASDLVEQEVDLPENLN